MSLNNDLNQYDPTKIAADSSSSNLQDTAGLEKVGTPKEMPPTGQTEKKSPNTNPSALEGKQTSGSIGGQLSKLLSSLPTGDQVKNFFGGVLGGLASAGKALGHLASTAKKNMGANTDIQSQTKTVLNPLFKKNETSKTETPSQAPARPPRPLLDAVRSGDVGAVKTLIASGKTDTVRDLNAAKAAVNQMTDATKKGEMLNALKRDLPEPPVKSDASPTAAPTTIGTSAPQKPPRPLLDAVKRGDAETVKTLMKGDTTTGMIKHDLKIAAGFARQLGDKSSEMLAALNIREMPGPPPPPRDDEPARPTKPLPKTPQQLKPLPKEPRFGEAMPAGPKKMVLTESLENVLGGANIASSPKQFTENKSKQLLAELKNSKTDIEKEAIISCLTPAEKDSLQAEIISRIKELAPKREGVSPKSPKRDSYNAEMTRLSELSQLIVNSGSNEVGVKTFLEGKVTELKERLRDSKALSKSEIDSALVLLSRAANKGVEDGAMPASKLLDRTEVQKYLQETPAAKDTFAKTQVAFMAGPAYRAGQNVSSTIPLIMDNFNFIMNEVAATRPKGRAFVEEVGSGNDMDVRRTFDSMVLLDHKLAAAKELLEDPIEILLNKGIESQETVTETNKETNVETTKNITVFKKGNPEKINQGNLFSAMSIIGIGIAGPIGKSYSETLQPAIIKTCERYISTLDLPGAEKKALTDELKTLENNFKVTGDLRPLNAFISKISQPAILQKAQSLVQAAPSENQVALQDELNALSASLKPGDDLTALHSFISKLSLPGLLEKAQGLVANAPPQDQAALQEKLTALSAPLQPGDDLSPLVNFISKFATG